MRSTFYLLAAALFLVTSSSFGQNDYRKGYYIDVENNKAEVFLQYKDYSKLNLPENQENPIKFKSGTEGATEEISQAKVKEISIADEFKFQRFLIPLLKNYTNQPIHELQNKNLLLQVLVEGEASLYAYHNKKKVIYFYKLANASVPVELTHDVKTYGGEVVNTNSGYRRELYAVLKTDKLQPSDFAKIKYNEDDLIKIFNRYNNEGGNGSLTFKNEFSKSKLVFTGFVNLNNSSVKVGNAYSYSDKKALFSFGLGAEAELRTSAHWAFFLRASYQTSDYTLKTKEAEKSTIKYISTFDVDTKSVDVVLSPRYYIPIDRNSTLFFNLGFGMAIQSGSVSEVQSSRLTTTAYDRAPLALKLKTTMSINPAVGYSFAQKYSIELQYYSIKDYFEAPAGFQDFKVQNNQFNLSLRYSFI